MLFSSTTTTCSVLFLCLAFLPWLAQTADPLNAEFLTIIATDPAEVNWPVLFTATYNDPNVNVNELVFVWKFQGASQACTIRGRANTNPCRNRAMEKTWSAAGTYAVTLTVAHPGGPAITAYRYVVIENELPAGPVVERHELRTLSFSDWNQTVHALWTMKSNGMYDHLVYLHQVASFTGIRAGTLRNSAHRGPAFLPWHRIIIRVFERCMQVVMNNPNWGLPYWDWTIDASLPNGPASSNVWTDLWFGPNGDPRANYAVTSGPFCSVPTSTCPGQWPLLPQLAGPFLERELGRLISNTPTAWQVNNILTVYNYDAPPYNEYTLASRSFRQALEGWAGSPFYGPGHNGIHDWIGGSMSPMTSPNDPVFWFHHCNVDRIYFQWQVQRQCYSNCFVPSSDDYSITKATTGSVYINGEWRLPGHQWGDFMYPWSLRPADVADYNNSLKGYYYN